MEINVEKRIKNSFARQTVMTTIGASITRVKPGEVSVEVPFRSDLTQQHGFFHAGVVTMIVDTACGYAALTCMPAVAAVLTVEYKVNFLSPASGEKLIARGRVLKPGRTLTVCFGEVHALKEGKEKLVATMLATMMKCEDTGLTD
ncbi:MAG TPA: PaaI family thioesterase [Candidatus Hydrogenedentes bacterium]|nr:PaaI family thioesterase [Candidatus Hydrogenedentota bacterium]